MRPATIVLVGGSDELDAVAGQEGLELFGAIALVGEDPLSGTQQGGLGLEEAPATRADDLGLASAKVTGNARVHTRWSRSPQKKRKRLAQ